MSIVKMKRLRLVAMQPEREELLKALQRMGCVEIDQQEGPPDDPVWAALSHPDGAALNKARNDGAAAAAALASLKQYAALKGGAFSERPVLSEKEFFDEAAYASALELAAKINSSARKIQSLRAEESKLRAQKASLVPWLPLDVPLDSVSTREVAVQFGSIPSRASLEELTAALAAATPLAQVIPAGTDQDARYFLYLCHKSAAAEAGEVLKEFSFSSAALKGWTGTAKENDAALDAELSRLAAAVEAEEKAIAGRGDRKGDLERCVDRANQEISRYEAAGRLMDTELAFYMDGWVPAGSVDELSSVLAPFTCAWETSDPTEEEVPDVPIKLKNNWFTKPLNMVTNMYVLPAYDGLDPNPLMAPFFITFFGLMMADMAYGLLMVAGGLFLLKKVKPKGGLADMAGLLLLCGFSTLVFGALTGGFLGDFLPQIAKIIDPDTTFTSLPALFTPLSDTLAILIGSLVLGAIQVFTGMAISVVYQARNGAFMDAFWNEITWWVILGGAGLAIAGIGSVAGYPVVLIVGCLMLVYGSTRKAKGFGKVSALIGAVYNGATGFFSDILSYARLMALMLAGSVIAQVFNTLGSVTGNVITFVIISLIGNALNLALNLLGCYVHDLRLQCLEFFGRFYKEGGKPFRPLEINTKYVDVVQDK